MKNEILLRDLFAFYCRIAETNEDLVSWDTFRNSIEKHHEDPDVVAMVKNIKREEADIKYYREFFKYILNKDMNNNE